jgi:hypothetical protein
VGGDRSHGATFFTSNGVKISKLEERKSRHDFP